MIELYAVVDHPGPPLPSLAPLRAVTSDGLALVCAPAGELATSPDALWRHERVVEALMEERDLLPVRYGTRVEDDDAAVRALEERRDDLARALDRVRGAVELSVRVLGEPEAARPAPTAAGSGADYLRAKGRASAAQRAAECLVDGALAALARASTQRRPGSSAELMRAAYLVDRDRVDDFVARVAALQNEHPELKLLCTGPWPPYSFSAS